MPSDERIEEVEGSILNTAGLTVDNLWQRILGEGLNEWDRLNKQGLTGDEMTAAIDDFLNGLSQKYVDGQASEAANTAYSEGRSAELLTLADAAELAWVIRSEIMDASICAFCKTVDGIVVLVGTPEYEYYKPPAGCLGGRRCRGLYVPGVGEPPEDSREAPPIPVPSTEPAEQLALPFADDPVPVPEGVARFRNRVARWREEWDKHGNAYDLVKNHPEGIGDAEERFYDGSTLQYVIDEAWVRVGEEFNSNHPWITDDDLPSFDRQMMSEWSRFPNSQVASLIRNGLRLAWGENLAEAFWSGGSDQVFGHEANLDRYRAAIFEVLPFSARQLLTEFVEQELGLTNQEDIQGVILDEAQAFFDDWIVARAAMVDWYMEDFGGIGELSRGHGMHGEVHEWIDAFAEEQMYVPNGGSSWSVDRGLLWSFGTTQNAQVMFNAETDQENWFGTWHEGVDRFGYQTDELEYVVMGNTMVDLLPSTIRLLPDAFPVTYRDEILSLILSEDPDDRAAAWTVVEARDPDLYAKLAALAERGWDIRLNTTYRSSALGDSGGPPLTNTADVQIPGSGTIDPKPNAPEDF